MTRLSCLLGVIWAICSFSPAMGGILAGGPEVACNVVSSNPTTTIPASTASAYPEWELVDTNAAISRWSHNMAYDSARGVFVMFGGRDANPFADTWEYNGTCWSQVATGNSPPARFWHAMIYDNNRQRIVLFGGGDPDNTVFLNDTWEYDGTNWQQVLTPNSPPPMLSRTMVFDSVRNRTVLLAADGIGAAYNDTWEYDGSDWTQVDTPVSPPPPGALAAMAYDVARERTVLTLDDGTPQLATWEYNGSTWAKVSTVLSPLGRWAHSMTYDACSRHVVLFGGYSPYQGSGSGMSDTWEYNGSEWTQIAASESPGPVQQYAMAFDPATGRVILNVWGQTWAYTSPFANEEFCGPLPGRETVRVEITSPNTVLDSKPALINIPQKSTGVQLSASLVRNGSATPLDPSEVSYSVTHPAGDWVADPESIISIDAGGVAHYNNEGYVSVTATTATDACQLTSGEYLLATGDVYGNPLSDEVIAVFPTDYVPDTSTYSFGDMMAGYPDMMRYLNIGYGVSSEMYKGFRPFSGDKQILAPLVEDVCGMPGNPLATSPCCYMNCGNGSPQYNVIIHEMGHNFSLSKAMQQLLWSDQGQIGASGFSECVASLPVIYFEEEILHNGAAYEISPGSFEYEYSMGNREYYCSTSQAGLDEFEQFITDGLTDGVFNNPDLFDGVQVFCSFFESFSCDYIDGENVFKHHMVRRFLNIFDNTELPEFIPEKVETYFAAAYSVAAGRDMRTRLKFWGFNIDDEFYEQIEPLIRLKVRENVIFLDGFE